MPFSSQFPANSALNLKNNRRRQFDENENDAILLELNEVYVVILGIKDVALDGASRPPILF